MDVDVDSARGTDPAGPFPLVKKRHTFSVIVGVICKPVLDAANIDFEHYMRGGDEPVSRTAAGRATRGRGGEGDRKTWLTHIFSWSRLKSWYLVSVTESRHDE